MATLQHGTQLGKYVIGRLLGAGRSASVYETTGPDGKPRALKVLDALVPLGPRYRERFLQKRAQVAGIVHANVAGHVDAGIDGGRAWVLGELVRGPSLRQLAGAGTGRIPVDRVVDLVRQAAEGIAAAHAKGIVHGDVRPENILVEPGDRVKVSDFGQADIGVKTAPQKDLAAGLYAAPERLVQGSLAISTDVYALGLVLHELCTGKHPALGPLGTPVETCRWHIMEQPPSLASLSTAERAFPDDLSDLCARALAKEPALRCSMRELADGLAEVLARLRPPAVPIVPVVPTAPVASIEPIPPTRRAVAEVAVSRARRPFSGRARWPAIAAVLVLGSGGTGWLLGAGGAPAARAPPAITADRASVTATATAPPPARATVPRPRAPPPARVRAPPPRALPPFP